VNHSFSCLGLSFLGVCAHDPAKPTNIYFTLGDVVAALTITLLIPQFLKPIFMFRLMARKLPLPPLTALYMLVALGSLSVLIGAIVVNLPVSRENTLAYPIFWEIVGFVLFGVAYGYLTLSFLLPAPVRAGTYQRFAEAAAELLANADERDHVDFSRDLVRNIDRLVRCAMSLEIYPKEQRSAFFDFAYRRKIVDAGSAASLLHIISDPTFCATLVRRCPWQAVRIVLTLCRRELSSRSVRKFVQELARQALLSD
jgi:hypothetical protein